MTKVKICGITQAKDAEFAIKAGADALGFVFAPSPRQITLAQARRLLAELPVTILTFGVFVDQDPKWIRRVVDETGIDRIQMHGKEKAGVLKQFPKHCVVKALNPQHHDQVPASDPAKNAGAFLVDAFVPGQAGGTGRQANWAYARRLKVFKKELILSGGLNPENVGTAISKVGPDMVDVSSGVERGPGIKDHRKIKRFIQAVKAVA